MSKLTIQDLNLSFVPQVTSQDPLWQRCINLALRSGSENQRYGALVVRNGKIIGQGWNRLLKKGEPFPFKTTFFLHAERAAIGDAMFAQTPDTICGAVVYVAGFLVKERHPLVRRAAMINMGTCVQCARLYANHNLSVAFMSETGWIHLSGPKALQNAEMNAHILKERGITRRQFRQEICLYAPVRMQGRCSQFDN